MRVDVDDLVDLHEIAERSGKSAAAVKAMKFRDQIVPVKQFRMGPVFSWKQVRKALGLDE